MNKSNLGENIDVSFRLEHEDYRKVGIKGRNNNGGGDMENGEKNMESMVMSILI